VGVAFGLTCGAVGLAQVPVEVLPPPVPFAPADLSLPPPAAVVQPPSDPKKAVEEFIARNRKEADDAIKALTREAETLRARLRDVEEALERWRAVADALNREPRKRAYDPTPKVSIESTPKAPEEPALDVPPNAPLPREDDQKK